MKFLLVVVIVAVAALNAMAGSDSSSESSEEEEGVLACTCTGRWNRNLCTGVTTSKMIGCQGTSNTYLLCTGSVCSNETCPANELWNVSTQACSPCPTGMHVAANNRQCVCNYGTTYNETARGCSDCPLNATETNDYCFCPNTTSLDVIHNACKNCPSPSTISHGQCRCSNPTIWSSVSWSCINCPNGTEPDHDNDYCVCTGRFQMFNMTAMACDCVPGWQMNTTTNACQRDRASTSG
jgi:hypothetical protein